MNIVASELFGKQLAEIADFIAQDSPSRAAHFVESLGTRLALVTNHPFACRRSIYGDRDDQRDLIFKGYTIVYLIVRAKNEIVLLQIFAQNLPEGFDSA